MEGFEELLDTLMSHDNDARSAAEEAFNSTKQTRPTMLLQYLAHLMTNSEREEIRAFSAVLLRRSSSELWRASEGTALDEETRTIVKTALLTAIQTEEQKNIRNKAADTISTLALVIFAQEPTMDWPDLIPTLLGWCQSEESLHRESGLSIFSQLATYMGPMLASIEGLQENLRDIFGACLQDESDGAVRLAALKAVCNFLPVPDVTGFEALLEPMVTVVASALTEGDEEKARDSCDLLIELVDNDVKFLRPSMPEIATLMLNICGTEELEEATRHMGMEFLVAVAEKSPGLARKMSLVDSVFPMALQFMLTIEDDEEWEMHDEENEDEEYTSYDVGEEALDRLAMAIGGKTVLPVAQSLLPSFLENEDWRFRHAGLMSVSQIGEGCAKQIKDNLGDVIGLVLEKFGDPHPRVKWAAINTIGQMATDFGPDLQLQFHEQVLNALMEAMGDESARVQSHAAAAVINFCEHAEAFVMEPYLDTLLERLYVLLQHDRKIVLEQAITAVASVADSAEANFDKYYDNFMPYLKTVLAGATSKECRMMRGKAMECISLIGLAVGKERFCEDAKEVMEVLMQTQSAEMEPDDPQISYMLQAWTRICKCLGPDFVPYLPYVMPPLLKSAEIKPDMVVADADDDDGELEGMETVHIGDKRIGIRTSVLEEKATACNMMACFLSELGEGFFEYIEPTARIMVPLLQFYYHDEVRSAAVTCMPELIKCTVKFAEDNPGSDTSAVTELAQRVYDKLIESIIREPEVQLQIDMLEALQEVVDAAGTTCIGADRFPAFLEAVPKLWEEIEQRSSERGENAGGEDFDEEEWEVMQHEGQGDEEMQDMIIQAMGAFMKAYGRDFLSAFDSSGLGETYVGMLSSEEAAHRRIALCLYCDMIEYCPESAFGYLPHFLEAMLAFADPEQPPEVRQAAVYGLGACCKSFGESFAEHIERTLGRLTAVVAEPEAHSDVNESATDNAVCAIGKMITYCSGCVDVAAIVPGWLDQLPLRVDLEEGRHCNDFLCTLLTTHSEVVLGPSGTERMGKVLEIIGTALGTSTASEAASAQFEQFVQQVQSQLEPAQWEELMGSIDETVRARLVQFFESRA